MLVRLVVPTSRKAAPERAMISGMRKPSPISINSPRETMASPPAASSCTARKTAAAPRQVVFEIAVTGQDGECAEGGAPQVGVQDDSGGIDHVPQGRPREIRQRPLDARRDGGGLTGVPRQNLRSRGIDGAPDFADNQPTRKTCEAGRKLFEYLMNSRKFAEFLRIAHEFDSTCLCVGGATD